MKLQEQSVIKQVSIVEEVIRRVGDNMVVIIGAGAITSSISHYVVISCSLKPSDTLPSAAGAVRNDP